MPLTENDLTYPLSDDFWEMENETVPGQLLGTFQAYPAECFRPSTTVRTFKIPFSSNDFGNPATVVSQILGYATYDYISEGGDGNLVRVLPMVDFHFRHCVAARVDVAAISYHGLDADSDFDNLPPMASGNLYQWLILRVHFSAPRFRLGDRVDATDSWSGKSQFGADVNEASRFCVKEVLPGVTYDTAPPGNFVWSGLSGAQAQIRFPIPVARSFEDVKVTWLGVPYDAIPNNAIRWSLGRCNSIETTLPEIPSPATYKPETLRLHTYSIYDDFFPNGDRCAHITYTFKHRPFPPNSDYSGDAADGGWNVLLYPGSATYRRVVRAGDSSSGLYLTYDFNKLFLPEES